MLIDNPVVLGLLVAGIVWLCKVFGWAKDGWQSVVASMLVSVVIALIEAVVNGELIDLTLNEMLMMSGRLLMAAELIYQVIRRSIDAYNWAKART